MIRLSEQIDSDLDTEVFILVVSETDKQTCMKQITTDSIAQFSIFREVGRPKMAPVETFRYDEAMEFGLHELHQDEGTLQHDMQLYIAIGSMIVVPIQIVEDTTKPVTPRLRKIFFCKETKIDEMILLIRDSFIPAFGELEKTLQEKLQEAEEEWKQEEKK